MSDMHASQPAGGGPGPRQYAGEPERVTGWVGWIIFAGVTMIVLGAFSIIEGLVAVFQRSWYVSRSGLTGNELIVHVNYATWGWVHFGVGVAAVLVGFGVMTGAMWARVLGITIAVISAIINLAFIAAYPAWSIIIIAIDMAIIYALAVHGREMRYV